MATSKDNMKNIEAFVRSHFDLSGMKNDFEDKLREKQAKVTDALLATLTGNPNKVNIEEYQKVLEEAVFEPESNPDRLNQGQIQHLKDTLKILREKDMLKFMPSNGLSFKEIIQEYNILQMRLGELKNEDIPGLVECVNSFQDSGLVCPKVLVEKGIEIGKEILCHSSERERIIEHVQGMEYCADGLLRSANIACGKDLRKTEINKVKTKKGKKEALEKKNKLMNGNSDLQGNNLLCKWENHIIPFCENCGWQTLWLNAFTKKDVTIKEAKESTKNIWVNNIKKIKD